MEYVIYMSVMTASIDIHYYTLKITIDLTLTMIYISSIIKTKETKC